MKKKNNILSKVVFDDLIKRKQDDGWSGFQSNSKCRLGESKIFECEGEPNRTIKARCSQHGGTWQGYYTYTIDKL